MKTLEFEGYQVELEPEKITLRRSGDRAVLAYFRPYMLWFIMQEYEEHIGPFKVPVDFTQWRGVYGEGPVT